MAPDWGSARAHNEMVVGASLLSMAIKRPDRAALRRYSRPWKAIPAR